MFYCYQSQEQNERIEVLGVPFYVHKDNGVVRKMSVGGIPFNGSFREIYFLGMSTDHWMCSDWWGQQEALYDHSSRLFFGERVGQLRIMYADFTMELISVIFGVNCFNYDLVYKHQKIEKDVVGCSGPYDEPFRSDAKARRLLHNSLVLNENKAPDVQKMTKWVFGFTPKSDKKITGIVWMKEEGKRANFCLSAVTAVPFGEKEETGLKTVDLGFFLQKRYFAPVEALKHRIYQYKSEIPDQVPLLETEGFDAPDIRFYNRSGLDLFTNIYRKNILDMAYKKLSDDGMPHTSSPGAANFSYYVGLGTFNYATLCPTNIWTRDTGRLLIEVINAGYFDRAKAAVENLHEMLYYPSERFKIPHWKRKANCVNDPSNEGNENDGHAAIMMAVWYLYHKGGVDRDWLVQNREHLKAAADYYLWQRDHPELSNYDGILYTFSEASTQGYGGYDLYSNIISSFALTLYAKLFTEIGDTGYARELALFADSLKARAIERFTMDHPIYGKVLTDTTDDCWTYEYKRFVLALMFTDCMGYDLYLADRNLHDLLCRTFAAQKELFYNPYSGRQMGYGQGFLTSAALSLDLYDEYSDCVKATGNLCYHNYDENYIVPEGVVMHGSGEFWFRNSDLGNAVQQAEIIKVTRLMTGIDDFDGLRILPRLPAHMTGISVRDAFVRNRHFSYEYRRDDTLGSKVSDGTTVYSFSCSSEFTPDYVRFGPFEGENIQTDLKVLRTERINGKTYVYASV